MANLNNLQKNSSFTKLLFKYSGWDPNQIVEGDGFFIAMRFQLALLVAVVYLFLDSTFFLMQMKDNENSSFLITTHVLELIVGTVLFFLYETWYQKIWLTFVAR